MIKALILALVIGLLAGCMSIEEIDRRSMTREGLPVAYQDGYIHGCKSGKEATGYGRPTKDINRYGSGGHYTTGWDDGYQKCRASAKVVEDYYSRRR